MLAAFDSNILLYGLMEPTSAKGIVSLDLVERGGVANAIVPAQVLGEVLAVVRRRRPDLFGLAIETVEALTRAFHIAPTERDVMLRAAALAERHRLQVWDSVICMAAAKAGATHLLSEDMQDGFLSMDLVIVDPFVEGNRSLLARLLPSSY